MRRNKTQTVNFNVSFFFVKMKLSSKGSFVDNVVLGINKLYVKRSAPSLCEKVKIKKRNLNVSSLLLKQISKQLV